MEEPPLEELVRKKGPEKFAENEYKSKPEVEEIIDCDIIEGVESEGVLVGVDYVERVQEEKTKKGYTIQEKKTTGKWDLLEIKDGKEPDLIDELEYSIKEMKGVKKITRNVGSLAGGFGVGTLAAGLVAYFTGDFGTASFLFGGLGVLSGGLAGLSIGDEVGRKLEGKKVPKEARRQRKEILEQYSQVI